MAVSVIIAVGVLGAVAAARWPNVGGQPSAQTTGVLADAVVQPALTPGVVAGDKDAIARLDRVVRDHVLGDSIVRVKFWTVDGRIVYSDESRLIGQSFPLGEDEREVLATPATRAEVSDLDEPENTYERGQGRLLEVYRPVWTSDGEVLLFETYGPYSQVTSRTWDLWRGFAGVTFSSLLILVVLLLPVLWRLLDRLRSAQRSGRCCSAGDQHLQRGASANCGDAARRSRPGAGGRLLRRRRSRRRGRAAWGPDPGRFVAGRGRHRPDQHRRLEVTPGRHLSTEPDTPGSAQRSMISRVACGTATSTCGCRSPTICRGWTPARRGWSSGWPRSCCAMSPSTPRRRGRGQTRAGRVDDPVGHRRRRHRIRAGEAARPPGFGALRTPAAEGRGGRGRRPAQRGLDARCRHALAAGGTSVTTAASGMIIGTSR